MEFIIVPARDGHIPAVLAIELEGADSPWSEHSFRQELESADAYFSAAELGEECVGFCILKLLGTEAEIYDIAVRADMRRRGVGSALLSDAVDHAWASGADAVFLEVRSGNVPARAMYSSFGFEPVGLRKGYYSASGEDAILMKLERSA